jgi:hypothetical protein
VGRNSSVFFFTTYLFATFSLFVCGVGAINPERVRFFSSHLDDRI